MTPIKGKNSTDGFNPPKMEVSQIDPGSRVIAAVESPDFAGRFLVYLSSKTGRFWRDKCKEIHPLSPSSSAASLGIKA